MKHSLTLRAHNFVCALAAAAALFLNLSAHAQDTNGNDYFVNAQRLDLNGRLQLTTTGFSTEVGESATNGNRTAWFVWTAPQDAPAQVRFSTYGSNYNTIISLYTKPAGTAPLVTSLVPVTTAPENPVVTDDDPNLPAINTGYLTWSPQVGVTYYIVVGRTGGGGGNSTLEATFGPVLAADAITPSIPNDNIAGALEFVPVVTSPTTQIPRGAEVAGSTIGASAELGEQAIGAAAAPRGGTVWYKYTVGATPEVFSVEVTDIPGDVISDVILQGFINTAAPITPTFAQLTFQEEDRTSSIVGTPRLVINGAPGAQYYFRVTSTDGDGTLFHIRLDFNPIAPANDLITAAIPLDPTLPSVRNAGDDIYSATTTDPTGFNGNTSGANVWFSWRAPVSGLVKVRAIAPSPTATTGNFHPLGSTFDFDLEVYFDRSNPTDPVFDTSTNESVGGFDETDSPQEQTFYATKDVVYFIEIGGDNNINSAGRGFFAFVIEDARIVDVARTGVSYSSDGVLRNIGLPVVNRTGDVAFSAGFELGGPVTASKDSGLFFFTGGATNVVVVEGQQEFGTATDIDGDGINDDKVAFASFSNLFLADRTAGDGTNADLGFIASLAGNSNDEPLNKLNNKGLYRSDVAGASMREFRLNDYVNDSLTWNDGGGFIASLNTPVREAGDNTALVTGRMSGIPAIRDSAIFASTRNVVVQEEDPAPNTANGIEFGELSGIVTVNSADMLAFRATLRGTGVTAANDTALYSVADYNADPTALNYRLRAREGSVVAGSDGTPLAGAALLFSIGEPRLNARGRIAVLANFKPGSGVPAVSAGTDAAILSDLVSVDESFAIVAREGDTPRSATGMPLTGVRFVSFTAPALITNNAVVFTARVAGTGVTKANDLGIWLWDGTSSYLVAREGDPAPGITATGVRFKTLGIPLANVNGRIAFTGTLLGTGVTPANDSALWSVAEDGIIPSLRLREGDVYNFGNVELPFERTITSINVTTGSGGDDGFARGMDQDGGVAVLIGLSKGKGSAGQAVLKIAP